MRMEKGKKDTHLDPDLWPLILEILDLLFLVLVFISCGFVLIMPLNSGKNSPMPRAVRRDAITIHNGYIL